MKKTCKLTATLLTVMMILSVLTPLSVLGAKLPAAAAGSATSDSQSADGIAVWNLPTLPEGYHFSGKTYRTQDGGIYYYIEGKASEYGYIDGYWIDASGARADIQTGTAVPKTKTSFRRAQSLPASYDARSDGLVTSVKNQIGGTCWAHSACAAMEANLLKKNLANINEIDFSPYYIAWYAQNGYYAGVFDSRNDGLDYDMNILDLGGNTDYAAEVLKNGSGPVLASRFSFSSQDSAGLYAELGETLTYEMRFLQDYQVNDVFYVENDITAIKTALLEYGAVEIAYYASGAYNNEYSSSGAPCTYCCKAPETANHAVLIVGWDDSFSRTNFRSGSRPSANGAWLVKNSWGTDWGNDGYFWLSYEDQTVCDPAVYDVSLPDTDRNLYFYDGLSLFGNTLTKPKAANVFVAAGNENLTAVAYSAQKYNVNKNKNFKISIYKNLPDGYSAPTDGTLAFTQTVTETETPFITLNTPVPLQAGERFAVVFENMTDCFVEWDASYEANNTSFAGQSYIYENGQWKDSHLEGMGNVCIRAVTRNAAHTTPVVTFVCEAGGYVEKRLAAQDGTVELPASDGYTWTFALDNGAPFTGANVTQNTKVTAHCYSTAGVTVRKGACTETTYPCIYCGKEQKEADTTHEWTTWTQTATAATPGMTIFGCPNCGLQEEITYLSAYGDGFGGQVCPNVVWQICNGTLSVCGIGEICDFECANDAPWYDYAENIFAVTLGEGITRAGDYAFSELRFMSELQLPSTLTEIGLATFMESWALTTIDLPENLQKINPYAFFGVPCLEEIHYNQKLTHIGAFAFAGSTSLEELVIPGSLRRYDEEAFFSLPNVKRVIVEEGVILLERSLFYSPDLVEPLEEVVLPASLKTIYATCIENFRNTKRFTVAEDNANYASQNGVLFNKAQSDRSRY